MVNEYYREVKNGDLNNRMKVIYSIYSDIQSFKERGDICIIYVIYRYSNK